MLAKVMDVTEARSIYQTDYLRLKKERSGQRNAWTHKIRDEAMACFAKLGFPTNKDEEWRFTNVNPIATHPFEPPQYDIKGLTADAVQRAGLGTLAAGAVVFVNGWFSPELSFLRGIEQEVKVGSLAVALNEGWEWIEAHLARYASYRDHAFVALNTAMMQDGASVYIPPDRLVKEPIHLLFISTPAKKAAVSHPRNIIFIGRGSQATIVENYVGLEKGNYFTNAVTEIVVGENAVLDHYKLQRESDEAFHVATLQVCLGRNSNVSSHSISLGGALVRNDVNVVLDGEGGECTLNGFYMVSGEQHVDNHTRIDHVKPHGTSRQLYKGVLDGKSSAVFNGKIYVHKGAGKTDARQTNKNLLLSLDARIDTKPQLEIYNNDVKCTHGSTIGQLDQDAVFYLRSRGIGERSARSLLTYAFASDLIGLIRVDSMRAQLDKLLAARLQKDS